MGPDVKIVGIIPARMASTRFPGKPLAAINGIPMIGHVYLRSKMSSLLDEVYVATCDSEIQDFMTSIGAGVVMTAATHRRASDRTAEAMLKAEEEKGFRIDVVVMIQGDEPLIFPEMIDEAVRPLQQDAGIDVVNLMAPLKSQAEQEDPNKVKVVTDRNGFALYFSREPIPSRKMTRSKVPMYNQVPIIPFRRDSLLCFNELAPTPLEIVESIDMLRLLEHGYRVKMVVTEFETQSVDTPDDLWKVEEIMKTDSLFQTYAGSL